MQTVSIFDLLKIGVGPSSSHTLGPWRACLRFVDELPASAVESIQKVTIDLYGSLAKTGRGHGTDVAVQLGLSGVDPQRFDVSTIDERIQEIASTGHLFFAGRHKLPFDSATDIRYLTDQQLPFHPNALRISARLEDETSAEAVFYSIGGGFVVKEGEDSAVVPSEELPPHKIETASDLLAHCQANACSISDIVMQNELSWRSHTEIAEGLAEIRDAMISSVHRGCLTEGILPGGLNVTRRAARIMNRLLGNSPHTDIEDWKGSIRNQSCDFRSVMDWVSCFALAVNEENAAFGRIVTAPTNGAAGVIPAVLMYALYFCDLPEAAHAKFLLTAGQIGLIFKQCATISAALGGCQAEIGVSSAMAAAGLAECLGGTPSQAAEAAEIAMEHHLGLTCDPIGGLVQIPCIERNVMGAIKAITAAQLALERDATEARVTLDAVVRTMWETAQDMNGKYKETAEGGLAVQIPVNVSEC